MEAGLPLLEGDYPALFICAQPNAQGTGVFTNNNSGPATYVGVSTYFNATRSPLTFNASLSNDIYGNSDTVTPLSQSTLYVVKY